MRHYLPTHEHPVTQTKALFLGLLCAIWIGAGLIGHDPWKPDDAHSFWLIYHILQSGDWLVPAVLGEPSMDKPPLFYLTAAVFAKLFSPILPLHDGARLVSGFYSALTLIFTGLAGRELFGKGRGWDAAIILIGCLGILVTAHQLVTDLALLTGMAMMMYGYALAQRRTRLAGLLLGTGMGIGFMAKGFIAPMLFLLISVSLLTFSNWRTRPFFTSLAIAALCALPWLVIWPALLYLRSPQLFVEWAWTLNIGRWFDYARSGQYGGALYYLKILPWFAWPALPIAGWGVWQMRRKALKEPESQLLLTSFLIMLITLSLVPNIKDIFALPMLLPITLLATASLSLLRRGAANALDWFGIMTFALIGIAMWWGWAGLLLDNHAKITQWLKEYQPGFEPSVHTTSFWIAVTASILWIVLVWRVGRSMRRAVINWAAGVTIVWLLAMTIWMPWLDNGKSYRGMVTSLKKALPKHYNCIAGKQLDNDQRATFQYFGDIRVRRHPQQSCDLVLVYGSRLGDALENQAEWKKIWEGRRSSDKNERFRLYKKIAANR